MSELSRPTACRWGAIAVAMVLVFCAAGASQDTATSPAETSPESRPVTRAESPPVKHGLEGGLRVDKAGTFNIHYRGADLRGVLQLLSTQGRRNIVATREVTGTVTADLYGVTFKQALEAVLKASGFAYQEQENFIFVGTPEQLAVKRKVASELIRLSYIRAADAKTMITPLLSKVGLVSMTPAAATGISSSASDAGGDTLSAGDLLLVVDYPENIERIKKAIKDIDVKPDQVLIEATILSANLVEDNNLGVNFNALAGIDFQNLAGTITTIGAPALTANTINAVTLEGELGGSVRTAGFAALGTDSAGMTIGLLGNRVAMFITALESITETSVLANPKLLVLNKQKGEVLIVTRQGYRTETVTETGVSEQIEFLETGTRLLVRPYICKGGYVRMEIHPEESEGQLDDDGLPLETTTEVTSNVLVRDGHTIVIGGLFREETVNARSQIPFFGNIPYLGTLFRNTSDDIRRREIIILITPHIIQQDTAEAISEQLKDDAERFRIGQRRGLRWWGRDRLAQKHMRWAKKCLAKGQRSWAIWYLDLALSTSPTMAEAIYLKERLTGRPNWADEHRMSNAKYIIQRMIMHELGKPFERVVPPRKPRSATKIAPSVRKAFGIEPRIEDPLPPIDLLERKPKAELKGDSQFKVKAVVTDDRIVGKRLGRPDMPTTAPAGSKE